MRRTPANLTSHEIIGLRAIVARCSDSNLEGESGTVIDETKNMLKLDVKGKIKTVPKAVAQFSFILPDKRVIPVDGKTIQGRPEDRIAKLRRGR